MPFRHADSLRCSAYRLSVPAADDAVALIHHVLVALGIALLAVVGVQSNDLIAFCHDLIIQLMIGNRELLCLRLLGQAVFAVGSFFVIVESSQNHHPLVLFVKKGASIISTSSPAKCVSCIKYLVIVLNPFFVLKRKKGADLRLWIQS